MIAKFREIKRHVSTNGRWGLSIVASDEVEWPARGRLTKLGVFEGLDTFQFTPDPVAPWVHVVPADVKPLAGCEVVFSCSLQSGDYVTVLTGGDFYAYERYGYKGRSSRIEAYVDGRAVDLPPGVMAAMGLIPATPEPVEVEPPPLDNALQAALKAAGLAD